MVNSKTAQIWCLLLMPVLLWGCQRETRSIERPEKIVSKRQVVYNQETYSKLADLWEKYYDEFPSEDAYANWMYAARYAGLKNYESMLETGVKKYSANPTLLYLKALLKHGKVDNLEAIHLLERAVELDPTYNDPWYALATDYMSSGELEKMDVALRKLLEGGAVSEEVMDYNYNVLTLLDENAILITNGDNDTYPAWILTRILKYRPDVRIVNRSLLNTDWYPKYIMDEGVPDFITQDQLAELRKEVLSNIKDSKMAMPTAGPVSDDLLTKIIEAAEKVNRPVYLSATLYRTETINKYIEAGRNLGLMTIVNSYGKSYSRQIKNLVNKWLNDFRTAGLNSWQLKYGEQSNAGKMIMLNYAATFYVLIDEIIRYTPEKRLDLFNWYKNNILEIIPSIKVDKFNSAWCKSKDIKVIYDWCKSKNLLE